MVKVGVDKNQGVLGQATQGMKTNADLSLTTICIAKTVTHKLLTSGMPPK